MKNKMIFYFIVLTSIGILSGCTAGVRANNMAPKADTYDRLEYSPRLEHRISLGTVTVSEQAQHSPIPITSEDVRSAIKTALLTSGYGTRGEQDGDLTLNATMTDLDTPLIGFSLTTTSTIHYALTKDDGGTTVWEETIMMPYTAAFSESFEGQERLRISIEKSIQENVTHMLVAMSDANISAPDGSAALTAKEQAKITKKLTSKTRKHKKH